MKTSVASWAFHPVLRNRMAQTAKTMEIRCSVPVYLSSLRLKCGMALRNMPTAKIFSERTRILR